MQAIQLESLVHYRNLSDEIIEQMLEHEFDALTSFFEDSRKDDTRELRLAHSRFVSEQLASVPSTEQLRFLQRRQELVQQAMLNDSSTGTFRAFALQRLEIATVYGRVLIRRIEIERDRP